MEPIVIAEILESYGRYWFSKRNGLKAKESGAAIAKFKLGKLKDYDRVGWRWRKEIYESELSKEKHQLLIKFCKQQDILFMSSAFS